ncbi:MAG: response regulator, partial [Leptolyngbya sp. SIO1D8]|nr:response regulator [Leptolyngbya sp. SIO1D8]
QIDSIAGQGCTFRLQLSTALSTANVLLVETQGIPLALPIDFLQMSLLVSPEQIVTEDGQDTIVIDNRTIPVANLIDVLELPDSPIYSWVARPSRMNSDRRPCILLKVGNEQAGFFVDQLIDQREVVSKALSPLLKRVRNVTGATILGTGDICMILSPPDLLKSLQRQPLSETLTPAQSAPSRQPVILLVEDSPPVRIQEKRLFEGAGYEVVIATNGLEGYSTLSTRKFDAVVSDVEMPYLDGFSLVAKIRQLSEYDDLPIILVTTLDSDEDRKRGADAGANAYILKGRFNQEALLEALERLV